MSPDKLVELVGELVKDKKGHNPVALDLRKVSIVTDYFVIASAPSKIQTRAIAEHVEDELKQRGVTAVGRESDDDGRWLLLDFGDIVVHIFQEDARDFYNLERLWSEAELITL